METVPLIIFWFAKCAFHYILGRKMYVSLYFGLKHKHEELSREVNELNACRARLTTENGEQSRTIEEKEQLIAQLTRTKNSASQANEELKRALEEESKAKAALAHGVQASRHDNDLLREQYEEEQEAKLELQKQLTKSNAELVHWKGKYQVDAVKRAQWLFL